jgi:hypothetical protein
MLDLQRKMLIAIQGSLYRELVLEVELLLADSLVYVLPLMGLVIQI